MLDCLKAINWKKTGVFAAGVLFGTAGIKVLSSKDAKKVYTNCTAAVPALPRGGGHCNTVKVRRALEHGGHDRLFGISKG